MTLLKLSTIAKQTEGDLILKNINFSQRKLQKIAIAGETGSGKTTLLKIIAGLVQPDKGEVLFENKKIIGPDDTLVPGHPEISYLSQNFELAKFLRVEQVLTYSNTLSHEEANTLFEVCQINHLMKRKTDQLSGGERQRIAMARLLIGSPKLLLLDEPFTHLDIPHKNTLKSVIQNVGERLKITCILVSHDPQDTLSWADKILVMKDGRVVQQGTPEQIYRQPVSEYVAGLFGRYNLLSPDLACTLPGLSRVKWNKRKKVFFRPESFKLVARGKGLKGKVAQVSFFGDYYEINVSAAENMMNVRSETCSVSAGDTVYISFSPKGTWCQL